MRTELKNISTEWQGIFVLTPLWWISKTCTFSKWEEVFPSFYHICSPISALLSSSFSCFILLLYLNFSFSLPSYPGPLAPSSALPIGAQPTVDPVRLVEVTAAPELGHSVLGMSREKGERAREQGGDVREMSREVRGLVVITGPACYFRET